MSQYLSKFWVISLSYSFIIAISSLSGLPCSEKPSLVYFFEAMVRILGHQWEVLAFHPSIIRVVISYVIGREEKHFSMS